MKNFSLILAFLLYLGFALPAQIINCDQFCVLDIRMDTVPGYMIVTLYNGDTNHVNYPTLQVVDQNNDTIGNPQGTFNLFAQLAGDTIEHQIPATVSTLPPNFVGQVILTDQVWDTSCVWNYPMACTTNGVKEDFYEPGGLRIWPNPATESVMLELPQGFVAEEITFTDVTGKKVMLLSGNRKEISVSDLPAGAYFILVNTNQQSILSARMLKN